MHDGEIRWVQCLTVNDARKLDLNIEFTNAAEEAKR